MDAVASHSALHKRIRREELRMGLPVAGGLGLRGVRLEADANWTAATPLTLPVVPYPLPWTTVLSDPPTADVSWTGPNITIVQPGLWGASVSVEMTFEPWDGVSKAHDRGGVRIMVNGIQADLQMGAPSPTVTALLINSYVEAILGPRLLVADDVITVELVPSIGDIGATDWDVRARAEVYAVLWSEVS